LLGQIAGTSPAPPVAGLWKHFSAAISARIHYLASLGYPR